MSDNVAPSRRWFIAPLVAPLALFSPALAGRLVLAPGDGYQYYLPLHVLVARIWRTGQAPGWNPFEFSGAPLLATNQAAAFYPPNALFLMLSPVTANNLVVVVNFLIAGLGAALLARRLTNDGPAMAVAGVAFGLCGFMVGHLGHQSMIASISWLPWTLLGFDLLLERVTALRLLLGAGTLALSLLAGHGQMFFQIILALGLYALAMTASDGRPVWRSVAIAALLVGVGAALAAVQLLPTASILEATDRSKLSFGAATEYSFSWSHAILLLFPYLFGNAAGSGPYDESYRGLWNLTELSGYAGLAALVLAAVGVVVFRRDRRALALVVVGTVSLLIALGSSTPVASIVYRTPIYGQFRDWGRYAASFDLAVAVLAAFGVAALRRAEGPSRRTVGRTAAVAVAVMGVLGVVVPQLPALDDYVAPGRTAWFAVGVPLACAVLALACVLGFRRAPRAVSILLVAIVAVDAVASFAGFYEWRTRDVPVDVVEADMASPPRSQDPLGGGVFDAPGGIDRYVFSGLDIGIVPTVGKTDVRTQRSANGFDPLAPRDYMQAVGDMVYYGGIRDSAAMLRRPSRVLDVLRISVVLYDPRHDPRIPAPPPLSDTVLGGPGSDPGRPLPGSPAVRFEYRPRLADAYLVGAVRRTSHANAVAALRGQRPFDPENTTLVETECEPCRRMRAPGPAGQVRAKRWGTSSFQATVTADRPALLTVSQAWFPGWRGRVDGRSVPVLRANGVVQAIPVPAGTHEVKLFYQPPRLRLGLVLSTLTLMALLAWAFVTKLRRPI